MINAKESQLVDVAGIKPLKVSRAVQLGALALTLVGAAAWVGAVFVSPQRAWPNFLVNYFFFLVLGLSGAFFVALQHITNAYWSVTVRRLAEALISYLPVALVLGVVLFLGRHELYEWTHAAGASAHGAAAASAHDLEAQLVEMKRPYLNSTFFAIRLVAAFAIWIGLSLWMRRNSLRQDDDGADRFTLSNIKLSAVFIPLFAISFTLLSFDLIMSLEPTWFSTIFGVYCFAGLFYGGLALLALLAIYGRKQRAFGDEILNANHLHDIGKLMFAFTVFWAYIMFSQLMLQWYANLPEEISYYLRRFHGGWWGYSIALFLAHFVIPFFILLPREAKRRSSTLVVTALIMLIAQWMDTYFLVMPVFFPEGPVFGWIELGTLLGFIGVFTMSVSWFLGRVPAVPRRDPRLIDCVSHHQ